MISMQHSARQVLELFTGKPVRTDGTNDGSSSFLGTSTGKKNKKQSAHGLPSRRRLTPNHHPSLQSNVRCRGVSSDEPTATRRRTPR